MIRTVLAILAGIMCMLLGMRYAASLRADAARLTRWQHILQRLSLLLKERAHPLPEALRLAADGTALPDKLLQEAAGSIQREPLTTLAHAFDAACGPLLEKDCLLRLCSSLSRGSLEHRLLAIEHCISELGLMQQEAAARADKDAKLWQTLGGIGGLCMTIMLI